METHERCERCGTDIDVVRFGARRLCSGLCGPAEFGGVQWSAVVGAQAEGSPASRPPSVSGVDTMANGESQEQPPETIGGLGGLRTDLLAGSTHRKSDLNTTRRSIRERWAIPQEVRPGIVDRLIQIVDTEKTNVAGKDGNVYESFDAADKNSVQAARVLVAMEGQNQADEHLDAKNERLDDGKPTDVVVIQAPSRARIDQ